jgi:hypothetical protein
MSSKNSSHHTDSDVETHSDKETCDDRESQFSSDHFPHPHADQPILADPQRLHTSSAGVNSLPPRFQEPFASIDEVRKCWQSFAAEASVSYNVMRSTSDRYALECPTAARPAARPAVRPHAAVINVEDFNVADADHDPADIPADIPAILVDSAAGAADAAARIPACGFSFVAREHSRGGTHVTVVAYTPHSEECPCEPRPRGEYVQQCAMDLLKSLGDEQARVAKPKALRQHLRIACGVPRICASVLSVRLQLAKAAYFREDASEFLKLPAFFAEVAAQNPRTTAFVVTNDDDTIKRAFMALGCGIDMLDHCIPVLAVDAAHMKSQHKGIIMSLTAQDGERAVVPLAVAVVFGSESTESWTWFLTACRNHFPQLRTAPQAGRFTVVHDRMKGLIAAHREVFADPFIPDVFCFTHLLRNMKDTFRHQAPTQLFTEAAYATNEEDYNAAINALSPEHRAWVDNIGAGEDDDNVAGGATKWALAWSTRPRYGIMTSNVAESVNSWMESMRSMWPLRLFESWLAHVASKFHKRREEVRGMVDDNGRPLHLPRSSMVKQWGEKKIDARRYEIKPVAEQTWHVQQPSRGFRIVTIAPGTRSCTCGVPLMVGWPCVHVIAVALNQKMVVNQVTEDVFSVASLHRLYSTSADHLLKTVDSSVVIAHDEDQRVLPSVSDMEKKKGRPRSKARIRSRSEQRTSDKQVKCGSCGQLGHNKRRCTADEPQGGPKKRPRK